MNYFGSKSRICKYIVPIIQSAIDDSYTQMYIEPFCGGLNVIDKISCKTKIASDINEYLISLFGYVKWGGQLPDTVDKATYDEARRMWYSGSVPQDYPHWKIGCFGWLCSFSGRGFDGGRSYQGTEKKADGTIITRNYYQERRRNLYKQFQQPLCRDVLLTAKDYREYSGIRNAVIYCDPPYKNTKQFANSRNFDYDVFWNTMREWSRSNLVLISELEAPNDFDCIWQHEVSRSIKAKNKSKVVERLFKWRELRWKKVF